MLKIIARGVAKAIRRQYLGDQNKESRPPVGAGERLVDKPGPIRYRVCIYIVSDLPGKIKSRAFLGPKAGGYNVEKK